MVCVVLLAAVTAACAGAHSRPTVTGSNPKPDPNPAATPQSEPRSEEPALGGDDLVEIAAPSYAIMDALARPEAAWRVLPHVASIDDLGEDHGDLVWRVEHKFSFVRGGYVVRIRPEWGENGRHTIRFWIDKRFERDVDDAWGYFLLEPMGPDRTRLRYHVRAVLLPGIIRWLFSKKVEWALMVVPNRVKNFVDQFKAGPPEARPAM